MQTDKFGYWSASKVNQSMKLALVYCRVSSKRQEKERFGLETQEAMCKEWCEKNDVKIAKIIKDWWISWSTFERDGFDEVLSILDKQKKQLQKKLTKKGETEIKEPMITHFVCVDNSRVSRNDNLVETLLMTSRIRDAGVEILYVLNPIDVNTSAWMLQENILYAFASFERRNIRIKAINGMKARLYEWYRPFGSVPMGYDKAREGKNKIVVINPVSWPILREALEMYASWFLESDSAVLRYLWEKWVVSKSPRNINSKYHKSLTEKLFAPYRMYFYAGYLYYPSWTEDVIQGKHEALVSMKVIEQIIERRAWSNMIWKTHLKNNPDFPLKDFIACGNCWTKLCGYWSQGRKKKYAYYGCPNNKCDHRFQVQRDILTEQFNEMMNTSWLDEGMRELIKTVLEKLWSERAGFEKYLLDDKRKAIVEIDEKLKKLRIAISNTKNPELAQEFEEEWEIIKAEKTKLTEELHKKTAMDDAEFSKLLQQAKDIFLAPKTVRELSNTELKRMLITILFGDRLLYSKENRFRTAWNSLYHLVFNAIQNPDFLDQSKNKK